MTIPYRPYLSHRVNFSYFARFLPRKKSKRHNITQISSKTRPFSADEPRIAGKKSGTAKNTLLQVSPMVHSASAPAELNKFAASPGDSDDNTLDSCSKVPTSDELRGKRMEAHGSVDDNQSKVSYEQRCEHSGKNTADNVSYDADQVETTNQAVSTGRIDNNDDDQASGSNDNLHHAAMDDQKLDQEIPKATDFGSSISNFKQNLKNRFVDVSVKFRKNTQSSDGTEIFWQNEGDTQETARPTGKRNIFTAAQERGRTIFPDLKSRLSEFSNRSPKFERKKDWEKIIKERDSKTKIIQL